MADTWWRFYNTAPDHPKILNLTDAQFRAWATVNSMASKMGGEIPKDMGLVGKALRKGEGKARELVQVLLSARLLDPTDTGFRPHNWNEKQYKSDVSTERVKRFREREKERDCNAPETETKPETERKKKVSRASRFEEFWEVYPKKIGKGAAEKAFDKAVKDTTPEALIAGAQRFSALQAGKDPTYIAHPATWLNQKRWLDEDDPGPGVPALRLVSPEIAEQEQENLRRLGVI